MSEEKIKITRKNSFIEKINKKSQITNGKSELRHNFDKLLGKLNDNATIEIAFKELQIIIKENKTPENLRIYLNSFSSCPVNSSLNAKERTVLLLGYLASEFKENLIDPLEKDLISTIKKIVEIIKVFMKENSFGIHLACSNTMIELLNCFLLANQNKEQIIENFFNPLIELITSGSSKYAQSAAIISLSELCKNLSENKETLLEIYPKLIALISVIKI